MSDEPATDDTAPCVGCGMCCNGTLYDVARVAPGEEEIIRDAGLTLTQSGERTFFNLPCRHEQCGQCAIYETRFAICRSFRCALLRRYQAGDVGLDEALATVATAKSLLAKAVAADPAARNTVGRRGLREQLFAQSQSGAENERRQRARQLLDVVAVDTYLERWFRNPKSQ